MCSRFRGFKGIICTGRPVFFDHLTTDHQPVIGLHLVVAIGPQEKQRFPLLILSDPFSHSFRVSASTHCKSSRKITSGWVFSQKTSMNSSKTAVKRLRDSSAPISGSGGCGPITCSSSGITRVTSCPLGPQGSPYPVFPTLHSGLAFNRYLPGESPQRLDQRAVRDIVPELVKFAGDEETVFLGQRTGEFHRPGRFYRHRRIPRSASSRSLPG